MTEPSKRVHNFLTHPAVQAVSGATLGALVGFCLGTMFCGVFFGPGMATTISGVVGAFALSALCARSALNDKRHRIGADALAWVSSFAGFTVMMGASLSLFSLAGPALLVCAIGSGLLVASLLAVVR